MRVFISACVVVAGCAGLLGGSYALGVHTLDNSQRQWCSTLDLLTQHPVPKPADPKANPSRVDAYEVYTDFVMLRHKFGCQ